MNEKRALVFLCPMTALLLAVAVCASVAGYLGWAVSFVAVAMGGGVSAILLYLRAIVRAGQAERNVHGKALEILLEDIKKSNGILDDRTRRLDAAQKSMLHNQTAAESSLSSAHVLMTDAVRRIKISAQSADRSRKEITELVIARNTTILLALRAAVKDLQDELRQPLLTLNGMGKALSAGLDQQKLMGQEIKSSLSLLEAHTGKLAEMKVQFGLLQGFKSQLDALFASTGELQVGHREVGNSVARLLDQQEALVENTKNLHAAQQSARATSESFLKTLHSKCETIRVQGEMLPGEIVALRRLDAAIVPDFADLPGIGGWAITAQTLVSIVAEVLKNEERKNLLECGSGASTVWMALALRHRNEGHIYSLEHDPHFAQVTRKRLRENGLEKWATVIDAPLSDHKISNESYLWYDLTGLPSDLKVDLLLVDGPPASTGPRARYPAWPLLRRYLKPDAWVVLDDTVRPDEREIQASWMSEKLLGFELVHEMDLPKSVILKVKATTSGGSKG